MFQSGFTFQIRPHQIVPDSINGPKGVWFHDNTIASGPWFIDDAPDSQNVHVFKNTVNGSTVAGNPP